MAIGDELKLCIELVPRPLWNKNLRYILHDKKWKEIRQEVLRIHGQECKICKKQPNKLDCHEVWHYDDINLVQSLVEIIPLCKQCHLLKHIGMATNLAWEGRCNIQGLIRKFCSINRVPVKVFLDHYEEEIAKQEWRDQQIWTQDINFVLNYDIELIR